jgi:hypothetical protein
MDQPLDKKEIHYPDSNHIGKFSVLHEALSDGRNAPWLKALFGLCVVLDTQEDESGRGKQYICASELFEPLRDGEEIPKYRIEMAPLCRFADEFLESRRKDSGQFSFAAVRNTIVRVPAVQVKHIARQVH